MTKYYDNKLVHVDIAFNLTWYFGDYCRSPNTLNVIKKVVLIFAHLDVSTACVNIHVIALLRFWLRGEVGLMLTFSFLALLVKVNQVPGGAAFTGPISGRSRILA